MNTAFRLLFCAAADLDAGSYAGTPAAPVSSKISSAPLDAQKSEPKVERLATGQRVDPLTVAKEFPRLWMAFLHANFANPVHVAHVFGVTEKAATKWWQGIGGPNGARVALAAQLLPAATVYYLFGRDR